MSLVAYDADSDSDNSEQEENDGQQHASFTAAAGDVLAKKKSNKAVDDNISDEEDFIGQINNGDADDHFFDVKEPDLISLISEKLPNAKLKSLNPSFVDETEDVSSIPEKKDYGIKPEEPPAKKKKRQGPVQIVLPALSKLEEEEEEERKPKIQPSKSGSGLFSLLPAPKNSFTRKVSNSVLQSQSVSKTPALSATPNENNLKPQGVRKVGLVPHRVANPVKQTVKMVDKSDSEDDDDYLNVNSASSSYIQEDSSLAGPSMVGASMNINPVPGKYSSVPMSGPAHPQTQQEEMLGPAVAPYPPPAPSYPGPGDIAMHCMTLSLRLSFEVFIFICKLI